MSDSKLYRRVSTKGLINDPRVKAYDGRFRFLWRTHVQGCLRREIPNHITIDDYVRLSQDPCYYCKEKPGERVTDRGPVVAHGIDRLDNAKGYQLDNLVTCCKYCNAMKSSLGAELYLQRIVAVATALGMSFPK